MIFINLEAEAWPTDCMDRPVAHKGSEVRRVINEAKGGHERMSDINEMLDRDRVMQRRGLGNAKLYHRVHVAFDAKGFRDRCNALCPKRPAILAAFDAEDLGRPQTGDLSRHA